jgi:5-methylcytosine-specific restriction enzyme A
MPPLEEMPTAPLRPCPEPGCGVLVTHGRCPTHTRTRELYRGSRITRGYDKDWLRLRTWFVQQPKNHLCRRWSELGITRRRDEVDHIVPFKGLDDPLRLDPKNLQPLCIQHHREKTSGQ